MLLQLSTSVTRYEGNEVYPRAHEISVCALLKIGCSSRTSGEGDSSPETGRVTESPWKHLGGEYTRQREWPM